MKARTYYGINQINKGVFLLGLGYDQAMKQINYTVMIIVGCIVFFFLGYGSLFYLCTVVAFVRLLLSPFFYKKARIEIAAGNDLYYRMLLVKKYQPKGIVDNNNFLDNL